MGGGFGVRFFSTSVMDATKSNVELEWAVNQRGNCEDCSSDGRLLGKGEGGGYGWLRRYLGVEKFCGVDAGAGKNRSV
jgi:hypothetical protein